MTISSQDFSTIRGITDEIPTKYMRAIVTHLTSCIGINKQLWGARCHQLQRTRYVEGEDHLL